LDTLDPYTVHEAAGQRLADLLFDSLVTLGPGGEYQPVLAKSWTIANGGMDVTFVLRDGVTWHAAAKAPPAKLCADDVVTTVRLLSNPQSEVPNRERFNVVQSAEKVDDLKVTIHLRRAMVDPLRVLMFKILP